MDAALRLNQRSLTSLFAVALMFGLAGPSFAQSAADPVEKLRRTLNAIDDLAERDRQTKACLADLHTLGELRKAVVLREWRYRHTNPELAAVDQANRDALAERFRNTTHQVLSSGNSGSILAALEMLNETAAAMRAIGEPPTLTRPLTEDVAPLIGDTDPAIRAAAVRTLGRIDPDAGFALPLLTRLAKSTDPAQRIDAAAALGEMLQATAQPWTAKEFNPAIVLDRRLTAENAAKLLPLAGVCAADPNRDVRRRSLTTLVLAATLLERMTPSVRSETRDPNEVRSLALALREQLKFVNRCLRDHGADVKILAMNVLEKTAQARQHWLQQVTLTTQPGEELDDPLATGLAAALPTLGTTLNDDNVKVRRATLDVLELYGPLASAAAPATTRALKDEDRYVRWAAVRTLGAIGPAARPAIPALMKLLEDPDLDVRQTTAAVLQALDPMGQGPPRKPNQHHTPPRTPLPALVHSLTNDSVEMRLTALHSIAAMGANATPAIPVLAVTLGDSDARVRLAAVKALVSIGPAAKTAADALRQALKDDDPEVRKAAGEALLTLEREP
jgi:HEAT repeat protein